jgi:hypothetical protein
MESQVRLYRPTEGIFVEEDGNFFAVDATERDRLISSPCLQGRARSSCEGSHGLLGVLAPIVSHEVWPRRSPTIGVRTHAWKNRRMREAALLRQSLQRKEAGAVLQGERS